MYTAGVDARERLVTSTQELLWERGYTATSPRAIQDRAGAGQGSMYHHFSGKPDLARAALERTAETERARAEDLLGAPGTALERLVAYVRRERDALRGCPVGRHAADPDVIADPSLRAPLDETFTWLRGRLAGLVAAAFGDRVDAAALAATIVATVQGGYVLARSAGDPRPFADATEGLAELLESLGEATGHPTGDQPCT
jgi:TetR/AcrR family transcriptional regulator, transcriptional repressor for nem operon